MAVLVKTLNSLAYASVKTKQGLTVASIKTINGVDVTSGGGFVPTDIAGCNIWCDADQIVGLSDGDPVATWDDFSGNNNDGTQATSGSRPTYQTNELNGLPIVRFDGSDDYMGTPSLNVKTGFVVAKWSGAATFPNFNGLFTIGSLEFMIGRSGTSNIYDGGTISGLSPTRYVDGSVGIALSPMTGWHIIGFKCSTAITGSGVFGRDRGEASRYWNGDVAEIIGYTGELSDTDRGTVESYLTTKYGL